MTRTISNLDLPEIFDQRPSDTTKRDYGHALLIAGSAGKMGAAILAARACLRSGVGLLTVHIPSCGVEIMQTAVPEAMVSVDDGDYFLRSVPDDLERYDAIAIGPGIGTNDKTCKMLKQTLEDIEELNKQIQKQRNKPNGDEAPTVKVPLLDADALNIIAANPKRLLRMLPPRTIITPHAGEYARLFGTANAEQMATNYKLTIVQKQHQTNILTADGRCFVNTTGNPGMATAGSGDVLTGIILAMLAQKFPPDVAAILGVYLHGKAGDHAAKQQSQASMIASDIIEAMKYVTK